MMSDSAIGIFDSGLGGLTAVKQLEKVLPNENIIYWRRQYGFCHDERNP